MSSLQPTSLLIQMGAIPATFKGTPSEFAVAMIRRMQIVAPSGVGLINTGDAEPAANVGPWLKDGTQWYVWSEEIKRYVPQDLSAAETIWFKIGAATPTDSTPPLWLRTTATPTEDSPAYGKIVGWYAFTGGNWVPSNGIPESGPTESRPESPVNLQQYFDTDISVLLHWERSAWRTVAGSPGDVKAVANLVLTEALRYNPGWEVVGASNANIRGRIVMQATKDGTDDPATVLSVGAGIAQRGAFEVFGETDGVQINSSSDVPYPPQIAMWHLVKL